MSDPGFFQISNKNDADGTIVVVNAPTWSEFVTKLIDALGPEAADQIVEKFALTLLGKVQARTTHVPAQAPMTVSEVANALGATIDAPPVVCKHGEPAKFVSAGVSKTTGKPYRAFYACARSKADQCDFRANG